LQLEYLKVHKRLLKAGQIKAFLAETVGVLEGIQEDG